MKQTTFIKICTCLAAIAMLAACKKKQDVVYDRDIKSFVFPAALNKGLLTDVPCEIKGNDITVHMSNAADVKNLIPVFQLENARTIVKANGKVQESGISAVDFTAPVEYSVKSEDKAVRSYIVNVIRNAGIRKFGFYTDDNKNVLFKGDYQGIINGLNIAVNVPVGTDLSKLIARFELSDGAQTKVKGTVQQSGKDKQDYTQPVTFEVPDAATGAIDKFIVTVGFQTEPVWTLMSDNITKPRANNLRLAINPVTDLPYLAFYRTGNDEDGGTIATADRRAVAMAYNGNSWSYLGDKKGFTEGQASDVFIASDNAGTPYVSFVDYANAQKVTVKKYTNGAWSNVGTPGFTIAKPDYSAFAIDGSNTPYVSLSDKAGSVAGIARGAYAMYFNGTAWVPAPLSTPTAVFFTTLISAGGKVYMGIMDRSTGGNKPSLLVRDGNAWKYVGASSFSANGQVAFMGVSPAVALDETAYMLYQEAPSSGRVNHVMQYKNGVWAEIGTPTIVGSEKDNCVIAVHPNGRLFFAYSDGAGLFVKVFNTNTNNWYPAVKIGDTKPNEFDLKISPQGIPYLAVSFSSSDKTTVYKYDIP